MKILIPARNGSKGVPKKNRILLYKTLDIIPSEYKKDITISTDDEFIIDVCKSENIDYIERSETLSNDIAPMKYVLSDYIQKRSPNEPIILLYLTYPNRNWQDVLNAYNFYIVNKSNSLLCKKEVKTHPYLCMLELGNKGIQIKQHDLYRRQDYPKTFEISHYIGIFNPIEVNKLNMNLYNEQTDFFQIEDTLDVDTLEDIEKIKHTNA